MPLVPASGSGQEDQGLKVTLSYLEISRPAWVVKITPLLGVGRNQPQGCSSTPAFPSVDEAAHLAPPLSHTIPCCLFTPAWLSQSPLVVQQCSTYSRAGLFLLGRHLNSLGTKSTNCPHSKISFPPKTVRSPWRLVWLSRSQELESLSKPPGTSERNYGD